VISVTGGVRVPTSVLLAVLAAAGLLALAPALVRRYDATERLAAERALNTARVIDRRRRQRTVPGRRPVNPPRMFLALAAPALSLQGLAPVSAAPVSAVPVSATPVSAAPTSGAGRGRIGSGRLGSARVGSARVGSALGRPRRRPVVARRRHTPAIYRRRRVLLALVLLNISELCGVGLLGPGFWIGSAPSLFLLASYLVHLRNRAVAERRRRREAARRAARIALRQAELRREQERRLAARREALRRAAAARAAAQRESVRLSQRYVDSQRYVEPTGRSPVRGRAYEARAAGY
jgi:hypothetical protein